eukprot:comp22896_c0_seq1/m.36197 comp22896_c0_seq1/g.36197  ORF comp22896_c0_seq1/g.36197 comp22896_c0_seq1/m.36197 type:complete len:112 (-) comp22896_c0_seq1:426-761(-)
MANNRVRGPWADSLHSETVQEYVMAKSERYINRKNERDERRESRQHQRKALQRARQSAEEKQRVIEMGGYPELAPSASESVVPTKKMLAAKQTKCIKGNGGRSCGGRGGGR